MDSGTYNESTSVLPGLGYQIGIWYGPSIAIALLCTFGIVIVFYHVCSAVMYKTSKVQCRVFIDISTLLVFLIIFNVMNCLKVAARIHSAFECSSFSLWLASGIAAPLQELAIPFSFLLSQLVLYVLSRCSKETESATTATTAFIVSNEWPSTEVDPLVIKQETASYV